MFVQLDIFGNEVDYLTLKRRYLEQKMDEAFEQGVTCPKCGRRVEDRYSLYMSVHGELGHLDCLYEFPGEVVHCETCGRPLLKEGSFFGTFIAHSIVAFEVEVYDNPYSNSAETIYVCPSDLPPQDERSYLSYPEDNCYSRLFDTSWADFRYFVCEICGRTVCRQNPRNGWHSQYRVMDDGTEICLKCYEEMILESGCEREKFAAYKIPGMFLDEDDVIAHGYKPVFGFCHYFINSQETVKKLCRRALELIDKGYKVVVGYESMGIGGSEGYVTLYVKEI